MTPIEQLIADINAKIIPNGSGSITGNSLNAILNEVVSVLSNLNSTTLSTLPPSGVPADGQEWVMYDSGTGNSNIAITVEQYPTFASISTTNNNAHLVYVLSDETQNGFQTVYLYVGSNKIMQLITQ